VGLPVSSSGIAGCAGWERDEAGDRRHGIGWIGCGVERWVDAHQVVLDVGDPVLRSTNPNGLAGGEAKCRRDLHRLRAGPRRCRECTHAREAVGRGRRQQTRERQIEFVACAIDRDQIGQRARHDKQVLIRLEHYRATRHLRLQAQPGRREHRGGSAWRGQQHDVEPGGPGRVAADADPVEEIPGLLLRHTVEPLGHLGLEACGDGEHRLRDVALPASGPPIGQAGRHELLQHRKQRGAAPPVDHGRRDDAVHSPPPSRK
jgi:hypothetical protein